MNRGISRPASTRNFSTERHPWPAKYSEIFTGRKNLWFLLKYEFITMFISGMPGAIGYLLRKVFYPRIFKEVGRGCVFGRNITIRHPHKIRIGAHSFIDDGAVPRRQGSRQRRHTDRRKRLRRPKRHSELQGRFHLPGRFLQHFLELHPVFGNRDSAWEILFPRRELLSRRRRESQASWTCPRPSCSSRLCPRAGSG